MRPRDLALVRAILGAILPPETIVSVFGSRATGRTRRSSDLDLAIDAGRPLAHAEESALRDAFEDSDLPYVVDIVDLHACAASFRAVIERDRIDVAFARERLS